MNPQYVYRLLQDILSAFHYYYTISLGHHVRRDTHTHIWSPSHKKHQKQLLLNKWMKWTIIHFIPSFLTIMRPLCMCDFLSVALCVLITHGHTHDKEKQRKKRNCREHHKERKCFYVLSQLFLKCVCVQCMYVQNIFYFSY